MADPARPRDLLAAFRALPPHVTGQIIEGELHATPRPAGDHGVFSSSLGSDLGTPFMRGRGGPGGWWIIDEPELHLGSNILVPDLAGWRKSRLPVYPAGPHVDLAPDWVCEILSPSTAALDRVKKLPLYAREGVAHAWVVDPRARTLEAFTLDGNRWVLSSVHAEDDVVRCPPFEEVELELGTMWLPDTEQAAT
ncbi:MAG: Uma2 family endonuclease [Acidobacteriota bacterium]